MTMPEHFMVGDLRVDAPVEESRGARIVGQTWIGGVLHHVDLVRVRVFNGAQEADEDDRGVATEAYAAMQDFYEGAYQTVRLPCASGEWVLFVHPFDT